MSFVFKLFIEQTSDKGFRIIRKGLSLQTDISYAQGEKAGAFASMVRILDGEFYFDYHQGDLLIADIHLGIPGNHNVENAVAAITAALLLNIPVDGIKKALSNFKGVKRRFEYIVKGDHNIYIDDYAHHPAELKAFFTAVNSLYPNKKLTAVFQPHLFTRILQAL